MAVRRRRDDDDGRSRPIARLASAGRSSSGGGFETMSGMGATGGCPLTVIGIWKTSAHTHQRGDITEVVPFALPLERTELGDSIRQYREETLQQRKELGLSYDDGWVKCIDWDRGALVVEEEGLLALTRRRMLETPSSELRGTTRCQGLRSMETGFARMSRATSSTVGR